MDKFPLVVSYYTKDTLYQFAAQNLIDSLEHWGLEYHVEGIASLGSWERNCGYKPFFLYEKLEQFQRPLFWVDADAVFEKKPAYLPAFQADLAVRINKEWETSHPSYMMSGSLYINATEIGQRILKGWAKGCLEQLSDPHRTEEVWDQIVLRDLLLRKEYRAHIESLPSGYTAIDGNRLDEREITDVVIRHYQASRRFKKIINNVD